MKFLIALASVLALASAQQFGRPRFTQQAYQPALTQQAYQPAPVARRAAGNDANANVLQYDNNVNPDGSYDFVLQTDNGISFQERGTPRSFGGNPPVSPVVVQGSYAFTSPEGESISLTYEADENGYRPSSNALPTAPPVPPQILRALEYIARNGQRQK